MSSASGMFAYASPGWIWYGTYHLPCFFYHAFRNLCNNSNTYSVCLLSRDGAQVVEDGYEFFAKRHLVTLFSAPNYCGEFDNAGAMMSVDETLLCSFQVGWLSYQLSSMTQAPIRLLAAFRSWSPQRRRRNILMAGQGRDGPLHLRVNRRRRMQTRWDEEEGCIWWLPLTLCAASSVPSPHIFPSPHPTLVCFSIILLWSLLQYTHIRSFLSLSLHPLIFSGPSLQSLRRRCLYL